MELSRCMYVLYGFQLVWVSYGWLMLAEVRLGVEVKTLFYAIVKDMV